MSEKNQLAHIQCFVLLFEETPKRYIPTGNQPSFLGFSLDIKCFINRLDPNTLKVEGINISCETVATARQWNMLSAHAKVNATIRFCLGTSSFALTDAADKIVKAIPHLQGRATFFWFHKGSNPEFAFLNPQVSKKVPCDWPTSSELKSKQLASDVESLVTYVSSFRCPCISKFTGCEALMRSKSSCLAVGSAVLERSGGKPCLWGAGVSALLLWPLLVR